MSESVATGMICFIPCEHEAAEANARLIAAAPDLLEALENLCRYTAGKIPHLSQVPEYRDARAAITKAKGETRP